jgi:hypothetical protein
MSLGGTPPKTNDNVRDGISESEMLCSDQNAYTEVLEVNKRGRTVETGAVLFSTHLSHLEQPQTLKPKSGKDLQSSRSTEVKLVWLVDLSGIRYGQSYMAPQYAMR